MKRPLEAAAILALACLTAAPMASAADEGWPRCGRDDDCPGFYLNITTWQGDAKLSVGRSCLSGRRHVWGERDARETIQQWFDDNAADGQGRLCIPLHPEVDEIRITSTAGNCGHGGDDVIAAASKPGRDVVLHRSGGGNASAVLPGCHATIGNEEIGQVAYGGVALDFSDGYGFGDSYARDYFYGVYDGFGQGRVKLFNVGVYAISEFNTYHYRVEILARGRDDWTWGSQMENDR